MSVSEKQIRDMLIANKYERYAVEDILSFPQCVPYGKDGDIAINRFRQW